MREVGRDPYFTKEPLGAECRREIGAEYLDGHLPLMSHVSGEVHGCHTAMTEFTLDLVPAGKRGLQLIDGE